MAQRFNLHIAYYQHIFCNKTKIFHSKAEIYAKGVLLSHIRNIEQISEDMGVDYFQMQHFITESNWDACMLIDQVAGDVNITLPKRKLTGLFHFAKVYIWNK